MGSARDPVVGERVAEGSTPGARPSTQKRRWQDMSSRTVERVDLREYADLVAVVEPGGAGFRPAWEHGGSGAPPHGEPAGYPFLAHRVTAG